MYTPGYEEENKTKPEITKKIESTDEGLTAEQAAQSLYEGKKLVETMFDCLIVHTGVVNGHTHIAGDFITRVFRASTRGAVMRHNWFLDALYDMIAFVRLVCFTLFSGANGIFQVAIPVWRSSVDKQVIGIRDEHQQYLAAKGFFS